jgi:GGDEF domain-containing protein
MRLQWFAPTTAGLEAALVEIIARDTRPPGQPRYSATRATTGLTGIANRKYFDQALLQAVEDALANGEPLSLVSRTSITSSG